jgi:hypothetical protein
MLSAFLFAVIFNKFKLAAACHLIERQLAYALRWESKTMPKTRNPKFEAAFEF